MMTVILVVSVVVIVAGIAMWIYRATVMKAPVPIATLALVLLLGFGVFTHDRDQAREKAHDDCVSRVERSVGNRVMWVDLGNYLDEQGLADGAKVIRQLLDKNLPALSIGDCP